LYAAALATRAIMGRSGASLEDGLAARCPPAERGIGELMPRISVVIPTLSDVESRVLEMLRSQTLPPGEIEVVRGVRPNGRARNAGVARTHGDVLVFLDDDARPAHEQLIEKLVAPLLSDAGIGATGASR
jgi:cellulose synthase/poly-beta-1,6-N-acetylglucosamine synthase-like glycosyltransferase